MPIAPPDPPLTDGELLLRPFVAADASAISAACQDPEIPRWTRVPSPYTEADAREYVELSRLGWEEGTSAGFAVTDARTGELLASVGLVGVSGSAGEVGYWVAGAARGRRVATRAVRLVARWALLDLGLARLELVADIANPASQGVAARAGFAREGILRQALELKGRRSDCVLFSLLPSDLA